MRTPAHREPKIGEPTNGVIKADFTLTIKNLPKY